MGFWLPLIAGLVRLGGAEQRERVIERARFVLGLGGDERPSRALVRLGRKVFTKLHVSSRSQLAQVLPAEPNLAAQA